MRDTDTAPPAGFEWLVAPTESKPVGIAWKASRFGGHRFEWRVSYPYVDGGRLAVAVDSERDARRMRQQQLKAIAERNS